MMTVTTMLVCLCNCPSDYKCYALFILNCFSAHPLCCTALICIPNEALMVCLVRQLCLSTSLSFCAQHQIDLIYWTIAPLQQTSAPPAVENFVLDNDLEVVLSNKELLTLDAVSTVPSPVASQLSITSFPMHLTTAAKSSGLLNGSPQGQGDEQSLHPLHISMPISLQRR